MDNHLEELALHSFCYLTTTGRRTGKAHTIEIWFARNDSTLYLLAGGREQADWVKNIRKTAQVSVRIDTYHFAGQARDVHDKAEDALARHLVYDKYASSEEDLDEWAATALPIAIDL